MSVEQQDPNRLAWETLIEGTNEKVVHALVPGRDTMQGADTDALIQLGTPLGSTRFANFQSCDPSWKSYILTTVAPRTQEGGLYTKFTFAKDYSGSAATTPVLTVYDKRPHGWPPVLSHLYLKGTIDKPNYDCVNGVPGTTMVINIPTDIPDTDVIWSRDAYDGVTKIKRETFISSAPHNLNTPTEGLYPRSVHFGRHVLSVSIPPCLHNTVRVPQLTVSIPASSLFVIFGPQAFPATNDTDWVDHPVSDTQSQLNGLWIRIKETAIVPDV